MVVVLEALTTLPPWLVGSPNRITGFIAAKWQKAKNSTLPCRFRLTKCASPSLKPFNGASLSAQPQSFRGSQSIKRKDVPMDKLKLQYPFTNAAGQRIDTLEIKRLKRADLKAASRYSNDDADQEDFLFSRMTGLTLEDIDQLDIADSKALSDCFRQMLGIGEQPAAAG
ncbi:phage tail assembly protein [Chromobacterium violaceum]|nr:phage tail assembly protein [Chromobacterium violaceum]